MADVKLVIGAVYCHQEKLMSANDNKSLSISNLISSMFKSHRDHGEVTYVDVIDLRTCSKGGVGQRLIA